MQLVEQVLLWSSYHSLDLNRLKNSGDVGKFQKTTPHPHPPPQPAMQGCLSAYCPVFEAGAAVGEGPVLPTPVLAPPRLQHPYWG